MTEKVQILLLLFLLVVLSFEASAADRFYMPDFEIAPGETKEIQIYLDNEVSYTGFQCDVYLPEGISATNWALTDRITNHTLSSATLASGAVRIICFSITSAHLTGNEGALVTVSLTADNSLTVGDVHTVTLRNINFAETDATGHILPDTSCSVTIVPPIVLAERIELNQDNCLAIVGDTILLEATIYPDDVTEKAVVWEVSDQTKVSIETLANMRARVVVLQAGIATITVRTIDGSDLSASCSIDIYSDVNKVSSDSENVEYYDIRGLRVVQPRTGVYIVVEGNTVKKVAL